MSAISGFSAVTELVSQGEPQARAVAAEESPIHTLPPEMLENIFFYLDDIDAREAAGVCRLWGAVVISMTGRFAERLEGLLEHHFVEAPRWQLSVIEAERGRFSAIRVDILATGVCRGWGPVVTSMASCFAGVVEEQLEDHLGEAQRSQLSAIRTKFLASEELKDPQLLFDEANTKFILGLSNLLYIQNVGVLSKLSDLFDGEPQGEGSQPLFCSMVYRKAKFYL